MITLQQLQASTVTQAIRNIINLSQPPSFSLAGRDVVSTLENASANLNANEQSVKNQLSQLSWDDVASILFAMYIGRDLVTSMYSWKNTTQVTLAMQNLNQIFENQDQAVLVNQICEKVIRLYIYLLAWENRNLF